MSLGSKKKILDVIKWDDGTNDTLVWKHPAEDFNTSSVLIVHESQTAVFFKNGQVADVFSKADRYVLKTENIPVLRRIMELPTGGESTFHCEVYFVNRVERMAMKWGTDSKIQFIEPTYNFPMEIGASGEMSLCVQDARTFLVRLIGTEREITSDKLVDYFRGILKSKIKSYLAQVIQEQRLNIFEIDSQLDVLSGSLRERLKIVFEEYGVELIQFAISTVVRPEDNPDYQRLKKALANRHTDVLEERTNQQVELIRAETRAKKREIEGFTYQEERGFDVVEKIAGNEGTSQFGNMGIGLGMMTGIGGMLGGAVSNVVGNIIENTSFPYNNTYGMLNEGGAGKKTGEKVYQERTCQCGSHLPVEARFCMQCGQKLLPLCPNCGAEIVENARYCIQCGHQL